MSEAVASIAHPRLVILAGAATFTLALAAGRWVNIYLCVGLAAAATIGVVGLSSPARPASALWRAPKNTAVGLVVGLGLLVATYGVYPLAAPHVPALSSAVGALYEQLQATPGPVFGLPIVVLSVVAEELLWRGVLVTKLKGTWSGSRLVLMAAAISALPHLASGNWLLPLLAFGCGVVWTWQRLVTDSLLAPLATHLTWSLLVFSILPLDGSG